MRRAFPRCTCPVSVSLLRHSRLCFGVLVVWTQGACHMLSPVLVGMRVQGGGERERGREREARGSPAQTVVAGVGYVMDRGGGQVTFHPGNPRARVIGCRRNLAHQNTQTKSCAPKLADTPSYGCVAAGSVLAHRNTAVAWCVVARQNTQAS